MWEEKLRMNKIANIKTEKSRAELLQETKKKLTNMAKTSWVGGDAAKYFQLEQIF